MFTQQEIDQLGKASFEGEALKRTFKRGDEVVTLAFINDTKNRRQTRENLTFEHVHLFEKNHSIMHVRPMTIYSFMRMLGFEHTDNEPQIPLKL